MPSAAYTDRMGHVRALPLRLILTIAFLPIALAALPGCVAPAGHVIAAVRASAAHDTFNIVVWELRHAPDIVGALRAPQPDSAAIDEYFVTSARLREANAQGARILAAQSIGDQATADALTRADAIADELAAIRPRATSGLRSLTEQALREAGLVMDPPVLGEIVFPPVSFVMEELPRVLVVSPRERIDLMVSLPLRPDISAEEVIRLEGVMEARGLSAVVTRIGGMGTYPALVTPTSTLEFTLSTIVHEWVHHYLFFHPLGRTYGASTEMTTINETVANMIGLETAALALGRPAPEFRVPEARPTPSAGQRGAFDFGDFMRETRAEAEALLAEGKIDEAEAYMEARRVDLVQNHGYAIRKINQAYFAFHGSYADSPTGGVISPVYGQLIRVRAGSGSLGEFLRAARGIRTPEDLERLAAEQP